MSEITQAPAYPASFEDSWSEYHAYVEDTRKRLVARPELQTPEMQAMANYAIASLVAGGFQFYLAPRPDCPIFYRDAVWAPLIPWGGPASDMVYRWGFLDGRHDYRITGKRGTVLFTDFHLFDGYFGAETMRDLGNFDLDDFALEADGSFEIIASPRPQPGNWMKLDPTCSNIAIQMRETWWDWANETGTQLHVERIDDEPRTMLWSPEEFRQRLHWAGRLVEQTILRALGYGKMVRKMAGGENIFSQVLGESGENRNFGASPRAGYACACWNLEPGQALVIESAVPQARYWSLQLTSPFWDTLDFNHHQTGLNGHQVRIDSDGKVRFVIAHTDPGIHNWLDPMGLPLGQCMYRWYDGTVSGGPQAKLVPVSEIDAHLPADTARVNGDERKAAIRARSRASLARWGF
ncbi:DUF1214 domain-containing protein [Novosphingobium malaysiense]|uniref:DUF1214 domain-containing protein n=1 Tax=Novosphingobium malaysiense TaxID=1348853 RepID=A0A0B1ZDS3_9SPHN|nr:DUF1214 domain-containing protein [Novosphingobium malaysiense]KHK89189.1 hypothetical protein LK12_21975 [Novosphingobium malaysiense]